MSRQQGYPPLFEASFHRVLRVGLQLMAYQWQMQLMAGIEITFEEKERAWRELMRRDVQHERRLKPQRSRYQASRHRR